MFPCVTHGLFAWLLGRGLLTATLVLVLGHQGVVSLDHIHLQLCSPPVSLFHSCGVMVHQHCYGCRSAPDEGRPWFCDPCSHGEVECTGFGVLFVLKPRDVGVLLSGGGVLILGLP